MTESGPTTANRTLRRLANATYRPRRPAASSTLRQCSAARIAADGGGEIARCACFRTHDNVARRPATSAAWCACAEEDSLAENIQRAPLHPLDQFRAFLTLREKGTSQEEIAAAFFVSVAVVRQLSFASRMTL